MSKNIGALLHEAEARCAPLFADLDRIEDENFSRVLSSFQHHRVATHHFSGTTGYGYNDIGRDTLEHVFAEVFGAEDALVRPQIVSGTHALAICLFGLLKPGEHLLSAAGKPYDTLDEVIGIAGDSEGSLRAFGVDYSEVNLLADHTLDAASILSALKPNTRVVWIQRSRGYAWRASLTIENIETTAKAIHAIRPEIVVMVDNCYGEFVNTREPTMAGADVMAGSLIKNVGGGLAPTGGYIAGRQKCIERIAQRLTSPGIGREVGSYAQGYQTFFQGLFLAPHVVNQAMKTAVLTASTFDLLGYPVQPTFDAANRSDIIQAIEFGKPEWLIAFCKGIQAASPVDSFAIPEPWDMPGYQYPVIMAAGTFVAGASIELSADAPIRPPFVGYLQGSLTYLHGKAGICTALKILEEQGLL